MTSRTTLPPNSKIVSPSVDAMDRILIAEDHDSARGALENLLTWRGFSVVIATNGDEALKALAAPDGPSIALLDWEMPGMTGVEICRKIRNRHLDRYIYLIIITGREGEEDIAKAMAAGADDFIRKPFGVIEVIARLRTGQRTLKLERSLTSHIAEMERTHLTRRRGVSLLPICSYCKKIRDESGKWQDIETYIEKQIGMELTHGICPECMEKVKAEELGKAPGGLPRS